MERHETYYWARILPPVDIYEVVDITIRTVEETWFSGSSKKDKRAYIFPISALGETIFKERRDAVILAEEAEKNKKPISSETYYEEF